MAQDLTAYWCVEIDYREMGQDQAGLRLLILAAVAEGAWQGRAVLRESARAADQLGLPDVGVDAMRVLRNRVRYQDLPVTLAHPADNALAQAAAPARATISPLRAVAMPASLRTVGAASGQAAILSAARDGGDEDALGVLERVVEYPSLYGTLAGLEAVGAVVERIQRGELSDDLEAEAAETERRMRWDLGGVGDPDLLPSAAQVITDPSCLGDLRVVARAALLEMVAASLGIATARRLASTERDLRWAEAAAARSAREIRTSGLTEMERERG